MPALPAVAGLPGAATSGRPFDASMLLMGKAGLKKKSKKKRKMSKKAKAARSSAANGTPQQLSTRMLEGALAGLKKKRSRKKKKRGKRPGQQKRLGGNHKQNFQRQRDEAS